MSKKKMSDYLKDFDSFQNRKTSLIYKANIFVTDQINSIAKASGLELTGNTFYAPYKKDAFFSIDTDGKSATKSLERNDFHWFTLFESLSGFSSVYVGTGTNTLSGTGVAMVTSAASNDSNELQKFLLSVTNSDFTWGKDRKMKALIKIVDTANITAYIVSGLATATGRHIGFYVNNGNIYGSVANGTTESKTNAVAYSANDIILLESKFVSGKKIEFYINGTLIGTITTNLPSGTTSALNILNFYLETTTTAAKEINITYFDFWQANN